jgi:plastocyanin
MHALTRGILGAAAAALLVACGDATRSTSPATADRALSAKTEAGGTNHIVSMKDACDPTTFDAALQDPSACLRNGGVTFQEFVAQLQKHQQAGAWHFAPPSLTVSEGSTLTAINRGGEVHTFTEVEHFGGGMVPLLNNLSGNPTPAPECLALSPSDFVAPGGTFTATESEAGVEHYQCCIHPWMRMTVRVRGS